MKRLIMLIAIGFMSGCTDTYFTKSLIDYGYDDVVSIEPAWIMDVPIFKCGGKYSPMLQKRYIAHKNGLVKTGIICQTIVGNIITEN